MSVSPFFDEDRLVRARIDAVLNAQRPQPAEIPGLAYVPGRIAGPGFSIEDALGGSSVRAMIDEAMSKVQAEDARLRRMLPPAPRGTYWHGELQSHERVDFGAGRGEVVMRLVYRLFDERTNRPLPDPPLGPYPRGAE